MDSLPKEKIKDVAELYISQIEVPKNKGPIFILCPIGLIGSGKSTVLKELSARIGLVRIELDTIRKTLKEMGYNYSFTEEIALVVGEYFLSKGYGIAVDTDFIREEKRQKIEEIAQQKNIHVIYIHINPPEEFILHKLKNFKHTWLFRDADQAIENYNARKSLHHNMSIDFTYVFDPSKDNISHQIEEAAQKILTAVKD